MAFRPTLHFQTQVLQVIVDDHELMESYSQYLTPEFFEHPACRVIASLIMKFNDKYGGAPSKDSLMALVDRYSEAHAEVARQQLDLVALVDKVYQHITEVDAKFTKERLEEAIRHRWAERALMNAATLVGEGEYDKALHTFETAVSNKFQKDKDDAIHWASFNELDFPQEPLSTPVPTGFFYLDRDLQGGPRPGDLCLVIAPSGSGKTMTLINIARGAMLAGKRVLFITLEMTIEALARRFYASITRTDYWALKDPKIFEIAKRELVKWKTKNPDSDLAIKFWPTGSVTVKDISNYIKRHTTEHGEIDLIVVDYGDIVKPSQNYDSSYDEQGRIYTELKGLAQTWNVPVWTASQTNRAAFTAGNTGLHHTAESIKKIYVSDLALTQSQNEQERLARRFRLRNDKDRHHASSKEYQFEIDYSMSLITNICDADKEVSNSLTQVLKMGTGRR
jgi:replicative DNA helicase